MRLTILVSYFYIANCTVQRSQRKSHDKQLPNLSNKHRARGDVGRLTTKPNLEGNFTQKAIARFEPVNKEANLLNRNFKECLKQPLVIDILFSSNELLCDGFRKLTKEAQSWLVDESKNYTLARLRLPFLKETLAMIQLPDKQFNFTLFRKFKQVGVDPRKASEKGKRFVQNRLVKSGTGILESIFKYYWLSAAFRNKFLNCFYKSLASTLSAQEYFELESLLDWFHSEYHLINEIEYQRVKVIIKRHYTVTWNSSEYWSAWYSMRPL